MAENEAKDAGFFVSEENLWIEILDDRRIKRRNLSFVESSLSYSRKTLFLCSHLTLNTLFVHPYLGTAQLLLYVREEI